MSRYISIEHRRHPDDEPTTSSLVIPDAQAYRDGQVKPETARVGVLGVLPHRTAWRPKTAADRDALVSYLQSLEYEGEAAPAPRRNGLEEGTRQRAGLTGWRDADAGLSRDPSRYGAFPGSAWAKWYHEGYDEVAAQREAPAEPGGLTPLYRLWETVARFKRDGWRDVGFEPDGSYRLAKHLGPAGRGELLVRTDGTAEHVDPYGAE